MAGYAILFVAISTIFTCFPQTTLAQSLLQLPTLSVPLNTNDFSYDTQDPMLNLTTTSDILNYFHYPFTIYTATSQDGYKTTLYRIPKGITAASANCSIREPVLIHHGLLSSSADWFAQEADRNLPLILAESCFDVWVANGRGTTYSRGHTSLNASTDSDYWEFSFNEMGQYDLPAMIDLILDNSGAGTQKFTKLGYIGHSMGNTIFLICMHYHPEYSAKIRKYVALSPAGYVGHITSPVIQSYALVPNPTAELAFEALTKGQFGGDQVSYYMHELSPAICSYQLSSATFCSQEYYALGGYSTNVKLNRTVISRLMAHFPDTVSSRMITHFSQNVRSHKFESQARYLLTETSGMNATNMTLEQLYQPAVDAFLSANNALPLNQTVQLVNGTIVTLLRLQTTTTPRPSTTTTTQGSTTTTQAPLLVQPPFKYNLNNTRMPMMAMVGTQDALTPPIDVRQTFYEIGTANSSKQIIELDNCNHLDIISMDESKTRVFLPVRDYLAVDMPTTIQ